MGGVSHVMQIFLRNFPETPPLCAGSKWVKLLRPSFGWCFFPPPDLKNMRKSSNWITFSTNLVEKKQKHMKPSPRKSQDT